MSTYSTGNGFWRNCGCIVIVAIAALAWVIVTAIDHGLFDPLIRR